MIMNIKYCLACIALSANTSLSSDRMTFRSPRARLPIQSSSSPISRFPRSSSIHGKNSGVLSRTPSRLAFLSPSSYIAYSRAAKRCVTRRPTEQSHHPRSSGSAPLLFSTQTTDNINEMHSSNQHYHLTILIPAYNERSRIGSTLSSYIDYLSQTPVYQRSSQEAVVSAILCSGSVSILVMDDGSSDGTADFVRGKAWLNNTTTMKGNGTTGENCWRVDERVTCISLSENVGKGAAIEQGMMNLPFFRSDAINATGSISVRSVVLVADADGSGDLSCIDNMLHSLEELLQSTADATTRDNSNTKQSAAFDDPPALLVGYRQSSTAKPPLRKLLSWGFRTCVSLLFLGKYNLGVRDTQCGFKLMTPAAGTVLYRRLHLRRWTHDVEVVHRARLLGHCVGECGVSWVDKDGSKLVTKGSDAVFVSLRMLGEIAKMRVLYALGRWTVDMDKTE